MGRSPTSRLSACTRRRTRRRTRGETARPPAPGGDPRPPPTTPPPTTPPPTDPPPTTPPPGTKVDNPYAGARGYVNPEWKAKADAEASKKKTAGEKISAGLKAAWAAKTAAAA